VIEVSPVSGKKTTAAADRAGLKAALIPTLLVQGDDKAGMGSAITQAIAEAGINVAFLVAQVVDARFSAVMGFEDEAAAKQASTLIKKAVQKMGK
jgi:predicted amino acid-binding ACT domain protein